ncbi:MAG: maleylpyruvate isomerase family mycothiol-dependent enzyme [Acidimicrobiia bacterium]
MSRNPRGHRLGPGRRGQRRYRSGIDLARYLEAVRDGAAAVTAAIAQDNHAPVAACPGWRVGDLAAHVGHVHRWATEVVGSRSTEPVKLVPTAVPSDENLAGWVTEGAADLVALLAAADLDEPVWTFGPPPTVRFWPRRQAHETTMHGWDAGTAVGAAPSIPADLATDGIDETLSTVVPMAHRRSRVSGTGESFRFVQSDGAGVWDLRFDPDGVSRSAPESPDIVLTGSAEDLLLVLWRRRPLEAVDLAGDRGRWGRWSELVRAV